MSSALSHERRCAGARVRRSLLALCCWIAMATIMSGPGADAQREGVAERKREQVRLKDQQVLRSGSTAKPGGVELENICDVQTSLSAYCRCDSLTLQDASEAKCSIFNISDQNDSIWESFGTQSNLQELQLNVQEEGRLNFVPSVVLRNLPSLTMLQIRDASIDTLASQTFADAIQLRELKLNRNKIGHVRPMAFQGLAKLMELELSQNLLGSLERGIFTGLDSLRLLFLDHNNISLVEDSVFQNLKHLEELDLSGNNIAVLTGETLIGLTMLKKISLRGNQLAILGDNTFTHVSRLHRLDLSSNQLQVIRHQSLSGLHRLDNLDLSRNRLTGLDKAALAPIWTNLLNSSTKFSIEGNPLQCDCQLHWIVRDLRETSSSSNLKTNLDRLDCITDPETGLKKNMVAVLSTMDCKATTGFVPSTAAVTMRPSRGSTTVTYVVQDEPATKKQTLNVNDSGASLQLTSPAEGKQQHNHHNEPASSVATGNTRPKQSAGRSSAPTIVGFHFPNFIPLTLVFVYKMLL